MFGHFVMGGSPAGLPHPPPPAVLPLQKRRSTVQPGPSQQLGEQQRQQQQIQPNSIAPTGHCICDRPSALVICRRCGHDLLGRVLRPCAAHPRRIALMDLRECPSPQCRSVQLVELPMDGEEKEEEKEVAK